jgi:hypothetical protein
MKRRIPIPNPPVLLLMILIIGFGIQSFWQGYYLDDWITLYQFYKGGFARLADYAFVMNRPLVTWLWWVGFKILGYTPFYWTLWTLFWRWLTAVLLWCGWREIWPGRRIEISMAAALFVIYPVFLQQSSALTFSFHWMSYAIYALSILLMILAVRRPRFSILFTILSLFLSGVQVFSQEYYVGLELLRPVILWMLLPRPAGFRRRSDLKPVLMRYLPYALLLLVYVIWRLKFMPTPGTDRNTPIVLFDLLHTPFSAGLNLLVTAIKDLVMVWVGTWYQTYNPLAISLTPPATGLAWGLAGLLAAFLFLIWYSLARTEIKSGVPQPRSEGGLVAFGALATVLGLAPIWVIGQQVASTGLYSDRFGLPAMLGASLLVVGISELFSKRAYQIALVALLVGLAAGSQFRTATTFRYSWERQVNFYWQLAWRAPGLKPGTGLFGDGPITTYMGGWADVAAVNTLYGKADGGQLEDYWYFDTNKADLEEILKQTGKLTARKQERLNFEGQQSDNLVVQFRSQPNQCLWMLTQEDAANPFLTNPVKRALPLSNLSRVLPERVENTFPRNIFGAEPPHTWCYYYQKAQLARQSGQWEQMLALWKEAQSKGYNPKVPTEYEPFIQAAAHMDDWNLALDLTRRAVAVNNGVRGYMCASWARLLQELPQDRQPPGLIDILKGPNQCAQVHFN